MTNIFPPNDCSISLVISTSHLYQRKTFRSLIYPIKSLMSSLVGWNGLLTAELTEKIRLYDTLIKSLELSTKHMIQLLHPKDDESSLLKSLDVVMSDPYHNIRQFFSNNVSFPLSFLTYNWNNILCNLPFIYFSKGFKY